MKRSSNTLLPLSAILLSIGGGLLSCHTWECARVITVDSPIAPAPCQITPGGMIPAIHQSIALPATVMAATFVEEPAWREEEPQAAPQRAAPPQPQRLPPVELEAPPEMQQPQPQPAVVEEIPRRLCPVQIEVVADDIYVEQNPKRTGLRVQRISDDSSPR